MKNLISCFATIVILAAATSDAGETDRDTLFPGLRGSGPMCSWGIFTALKDIEKACPFDEHSNAARYLDASIEQLNRFMIDNRLVSQAQLDRLRESNSQRLSAEFLRKGVAELEKSCRGDADQHDLIWSYRQLQKLNAAQLQKSLSEQREELAQLREEFSRIGTAAALQRSAGCL